MTVAIIAAADTDHQLRCANQRLPGPETVDADPQRSNLRPGTLVVSCSRGASVRVGRVAVVDLANDSEFDNRGGATPQLNSSGLMISIIAFRRRGHLRRRP